MTSPVLSGKSVMLQPVESADLESLGHRFNAFETFRYIGRGEPLTAKAQADRHTRTRVDQSILAWAVARTDNSMLIGSISNRQNSDDPARWGELGELLRLPGSGFGSSVTTISAFGMTR